MKPDKYSSVKTTIDSGCQDSAPRYIKTQPRIVKYKNNRLLNPQQYNLPRQFCDAYGNPKPARSPLRLQKLMKPSKFQRPEPIKSCQLIGERGNEHQQKQILRNVEDDAVSRLSRASKGSIPSKFERSLRLQNQLKRVGKDKDLSKQLAMKIKNESIYNWNFHKNKPLSFSKNQQEKSVTHDFDEARSYYSLKSQKMKTETDACQRLEELKEEENELYQDQEVWSNPHLKLFLEQHGIRDKQELFDFLENNADYSPQLYSSEHLSNLGPYLRPPPTQYQRKFQGEDEDQNMPLLRQQDYQTLHKLAMMKLKQSVKNFTIAETQFNPKPMENSEGIRPDNWLRVEKKQICYGTSYEFNYPSRLDYELKIIEAPREEHVVPGCPLLGNTEYRNNFVDIPTQTFTASELAQFFKDKQINSNPLKVAKGVNFFNSTYRKQFVPRSLIKDQRIRAKSQLQCSIQHPKDSTPSMYMTSFQNDYTRYEPSRRRKQRVDPCKYGALSRLKNILLLNKSLKKQIAPHQPKDQSILIK